MNISLYELNRKFEAAQKKKSVKLKLYEQKLPNLNIEKNIQQKKKQNHRELRGNLRSVIYAQLQSHRQRERERERNTI